MPNCSTEGTRAYNSDMKVTRLRAALAIGSIALIGAIGAIVIADTDSKQRPADKSSDPAASNDVTPLPPPGTSSSAELEQFQAERDKELEKVQAQREQFQAELQKVQETSDRIAQQLRDKAEGRLTSN